MAPLDTGSIAELRVLRPLGAPSGPTPEQHSTLGAWMQAVREHRRAPLTDIAEQTRIKITHLKAIEADDFDALPSRAFAIGYVRAFAKTLELDPEAVVDRFKREHPDKPVPLQPPVGLVKETDDRRPLIYLAGGAVLAAVVLWNIAQHLVHREEPPRPSLAPAVAAAAPVEPAGPVKISPPTPVPIEQTLPAPYVTPGMEEAHDATDSAAAIRAAAAAAQGQAGPTAGRTRMVEGLLTAPDAPRALETRGAVYGDPNPKAPAMLLARNASALVVRAPDSRIVFARVLQPGEAYRIPLGRSLTADITDPAGLDLYVGGQLRGALTTLQTPLDKIAGPFLGAPPPRPAAPAPGAPPAVATAQPAPTPGSPKP